MTTRLSDRQVIDQFYEQVSWKDECNETVIFNRTWIRNDKSKCLFLPCYYEDYDKDKNDLLGLATGLKYEPSMIIYGDPGNAKVDELIFKSLSEYYLIHLEFIDVRARIAQSRFIHRALDGIDWNKAFTEVSNGNINYIPPEIR
ncbi:hypothetical protein [Nostoc sp. CCY 9925]|uniref:hypothetical protein n=1 Tax=Nostoc sp. CCY 9925 TaxID=3103865 RepID=UPI0039C5E7B1